MKIPNTVLACVLGFAVHATASAQIYESTDAEGVPEFSDTPTPGAAEIELPQTNVVTPVPVPPAPEVPEEAPAYPQEESPVAAEGGAEESEIEPAYIYYGGDDEPGPREQRREDAARIDNRLPHEVGDAVHEEAAGDAAVMHPDNAEAVARPEAPGVVHHAEGAGRR